jgi:hypothetical protein
MSSSPYHRLFRHGLVLGFLRCAVAAIIWLMIAKPNLGAAKPAIACEPRTCSLHCAALELRHQRALPEL